MENGIYILKTYGRVHKFIYHYGILIINNNNQYVLHNSEYNEINQNGGNIKKESYQDFLNKYNIIKFIKIESTENYVLTRTKPLLSKPYNKIFFNCNTYVKDIFPKQTPIAEEYYL